MQLLLLGPVLHRIWPERLRIPACEVTFDSGGVTFNDNCSLLWFPKKAVLRCIPKSPQGLESNTWEVTFNDKYSGLWLSRKTVLRYISKSPQGLESSTRHSQQELPLKTIFSFLNILFPFPSFALGSLPR